VRIVQEEGMPQHNFPSQKGNLYVTFVVGLPKKLSSEQQTKVKTIF
jgi:DnaJ-related protein SCJ1